MTDKVDLIDPAALKDLTVARGGHPDCLHCRLSTLVGLYFETRPEGPEHAATIAAALAEVIGELVAPAPDDRREPILDRMAELMRTKCAEDVARARSPHSPARPKQLH